MSPAPLKTPVSSDSTDEWRGPEPGKVRVTTTPCATDYRSARWAKWACCCWRSCWITKRRFSAEDRPVDVQADEKPVGASLLAMTVGQQTSMLNVPTPSRASPLPQWIEYTRKSQALRPGSLAEMASSRLWQRMKTEILLQRTHQLPVLRRRPLEAETGVEMLRGHVLMTPEATGL